MFYESLQEELQEELDELTLADSFGQANCQKIFNNYLRLLSEEEELHDYRVKEDILLNPSRGKQICLPTRKM